MIRTFLFDMGNVLFRFSHQRMYAQIGALFDLDAASVERRLNSDNLLLNFERGQIDERQLHQSVEQLFGRQVELKALAQAASDIFELNEPMPVLLSALKAEGYRLVVLSNTNSAHVAFLRREYDLLDMFDAFCFSHEAKAVKPEPEIFEHALTLTNCPAEECFYTDDIADYIAAARTHGIQAELFTTPQNLAHHLQARGILNGETVSRPCA